MTVVGALVAILVAYLSSIVRIPRPPQKGAPTQCSNPRVVLSTPGGGGYVRAGASWLRLACVLASSRARANRQAVRAMAANWVTIGSR